MLVCKQSLFKHFVSGCVISVNWNHCGTCRWSAYSIDLVPQAGRRLLRQLSLQQAQAQALARHRHKEVHTANRRPDKTLSPAKSASLDRAAEHEACMSPPHTPPPPSLQTMDLDSAVPAVALKPQSDIAVEHRLLRHVANGGCKQWRDAMDAGCDGSKGAHISSGLQIHEVA